jgi:hypothetical protein
MTKSMDDVMSSADVLVMMLSMAGEDVVHEHTKPDVIAVDEAGKVLEPEMWTPACPVPTLPYYHGWRY